MTGSWKSELRKAGAVSTRILREEGIVSLLLKTLEKLRRREFRILEAPAAERQKVLYDSVISRSMENNSFREIYENMLLNASSNLRDEPHGATSTTPISNDVKLVAFYLPQFHPIPENDRWWGKGFTEWTNVSKAVPQFVGHYQPRLPGELGFYDLRVIDVQKRQIELAKQHGIYGFCYYYYWFNGKRLLEQPLNQFLSHTEVQFPFCVCWVNENWTRRWDGLDNQILLAQTYPENWHLNFIKDLTNILRDERYIRVGQRPLLLVYNPAQLPSAKHVLNDWRAYCKQFGVEDPYIAAIQSFGFSDPRPLGFDAAVEFPPHRTDDIRLAEITNDVELLNPNFAGKIYDYREMVERQRSRDDRPPFDHFLGVMTDWDNEPRHVGTGITYAFSTPGLYARWLRWACQRTVATMSKEKRFVFINAWNEWAEGAYLEPDRKNGYGYLQATSAVLQSLVREKGADSPSKDYTSQEFDEIRKRHDTAVILHLYYPEMFEEIWSYIENLRGNFDLFVSIPINVTFDDEQIHRRHRSAQVWRCDNRGRDMAPFLHIFPQLYHLNYNYICKIHSKASTHRTDGDLWRRDIYAKLLGSNEQISKIKQALKRTEVGVVAAAGHVLPSEDYWGVEIAKNRSGVSYLCEEAELDAGDQQFTFVAGSMFWFKPPALGLLAALRIPNDAFEAELGQRDGTLAHGFERFLGLLTEQSGFTIAEIDTEGCIHTPRFGPGITRNFQWASATSMDVDIEPQG
jgi:lipopolysaccharide biosynthesis protein